jgi:type I restriction enzyme S subunit
VGKYERYEKYKGSGVKWLGQIPEDWQQKRLKFSVDLINNKIDAENSNLPYMGLEHIEPWTGKRIEDINALSEGIASHFRPDDVLFGKLRPYLAKVYLSEIEGLVSTEALVLRPKKDIYPKFLKYYILSRDFINIVDSSTFGAKMPRASWDFICNLFLAIPSLDEQQAIAHFLDHKTKQIDDLIAKKQALIEKLDEKCTALISHAVTKGLDPNVPMKDSGVEWLGEVPEHWKTGRLNYFCKIASGGTPDRNNPDFWEGNIPWVKTGEVNYQDIYSTEEFITKEGLNSSSTTLVKPETLLMAMYGQGNTRGRVAILKIEAAFNQACLAISPLNTLSVYFLYYYLMNAYHYIRDIGNESSQMNLSAGIIGKINILVPNLKEQQKIVQLLHQRTGKIDEQKAKIQKAIEILKEYRTALITNAVTGKIDIRQVPIP